MHSGRGYSLKHNDRHFDLDKADHINPEKTPFNKYYVWDEKDGESFEEAELRFYNKHFSDALKKTNQKYIDNRHSERCKTMLDWLKNKNTSPEEVIFQVGNVSNPVTDSLFGECMDEFNEWEENWNEAHGRPFEILDEARHVDEASPHEHKRRIWIYKDKDGTMKPGQDKALEQAGIGLPDPSKPRSRYNNRKMVFDKMAREKWIEIVKSHGLEVEEEPIKNSKHENKADYIRKREADIKAREDALKAQEDVLKQQAEDLQEKEKNVSEKLTEADVILDGMLESQRIQVQEEALMQEQMKQTKEALKTREADIKAREDALKTQEELLRQRVIELQAIKEKLEKRELRLSEKELKYDDRWDSMIQREQENERLIELGRKTDRAAKVRQAQRLSGNVKQQSENQYGFQDYPWE